METRSIYIKIFFVEILATDDSLLTNAPIASSSRRPEKRLKKRVFGMLMCSFKLNPSFTVHVIEAALGI
jgi:hypothetical protein